MVVHKTLTRKHRIEHANLLAILAFIAVAAYLSSNLKVFFANPERIKETVSSYGSLGPLVLVLFHITQTIIFFIPGPFISIAGGYLFGVFWGTVYNIIGSVVGSMSLFFIARKVGQSAFMRWLDEREYKHVEAVIQERGIWAVFFARLIPVFPNDALTIAAGVSPLKTRDFFIASSIGYIPTLYVENLLGDQLTQGITTKVLLLAGLLMLLAWIYILRHKIKVLLLKEVAAIENALHIKQANKVTAK
jgi:uncharacterized membrane protein YdjX (TVP38/TMEM64 family)